MNLKKLFKKKKDKSQEMIDESLGDYRQLIDNNRPETFSLSDYTVKKIWGSETWKDLNEFYALKIISMKKGFKSSLQYHEYKTEANYVIKGKCKLLIEIDGKVTERIITTGEGWIVPPMTLHRVIALTDYTALEVSSPHLNDVVRVEDDTNRTSGKILDEHNQS